MNKKDTQIVMVNMRSLFAYNGSFYEQISHLANCKTKFFCLMNMNITGNILKWTR